MDPKQFSYTYIYIWRLLKDRLGQEDVRWASQGLEKYNNPPTSYFSRCYVGFAIWGIWSLSGYFFCKDLKYQCYLVYLVHLLVGQAANVNKGFFFSVLKTEMDLYPLLSLCRSINLCAFSPTITKIKALILKICYY